MSTSVASLTDGLASNLIAEFIGLISGLIVTFLIVDRLTRRNLRLHYKPLSARLKAGVTSTVSSMLVAWAVALDIITTADTLSGGRPALDERVHNRLEALGEELGATILEIDTAGASRLAAATIEAGSEITHIADRLMQVVSSDVDLQALIADFEDAVDAVERIVMVHQGAGNAGEIQADVDRALVTLSRTALERAVQLRDYVERRL